MAASRRLQVAAEAGQAFVLLARPPEELDVLSAAGVRFVVTRTAIAPTRARCAAIVRVVAHVVAGEGRGRADAGVGRVVVGDVASVPVVPVPSLSFPSLSSPSLSSPRCRCEIPLFDGART
jgi:hypothetical protein